MKHGDKCEKFSNTKQVLNRTHSCWHAHTQKPTRTLTRNYGRKRTRTNKCTSTNTLALLLGYEITAMFSQYQGVFIIFRIKEYLILFYARLF